MVGVQQTITSFPSCILNTHPEFVEDLFFTTVVTLIW